MRLGFGLRHKKGVGVCFLVYPGVVGLRIALITQDRQRSLAHASTDYIFKVYRYAPRDASLPSACCDEWNLRSSRPTTTDVRKRLSYTIRPPAHPSGLTSDAAKIGNKFETAKETARNFLPVLLTSFATLSARPY